MYLHGEAENIIFNTRANFNVLKGFKTEYAIKNFFGTFFQKVNGLPLTFFEFFTKKQPNTDFSGSKIWRFITPRNLKIIKYELVLNTNMAINGDYIECYCRIHGF